MGGEGNGENTGKRVSCGGIMGMGTSRYGHGAGEVRVDGVIWHDRPIKQLSGRKASETGKSKRMKLPVAPRDRKFTLVIH